MAATKDSPIRFSPLTVFIWLVVAGGVILLLWNIITRIAGSNLPISTATPNRTQVYQTIAAMLTEQKSKPSPTSTQTDTPSPKPGQTQVEATRLPPTVTATLPIDINQTDTPPVLCDRAAAGNPIDITIPDDSRFPPGESFIKTWRLVNTGTCTWTTQYSASFFYGDRMGALESVPLQRSVAPDQNLEISIEMAAPHSPGTYQGNWKLMNEDGDLFGIGPNGDAPFWVRIVVEQDHTSTPAETAQATPAITPTATITATATITPTATPESDLIGTLLPLPGDSIDLDTLTLNTEGEDLVYRVDNETFHWLDPHDEALIGVAGSQQPSHSDCESGDMRSEPVGVDDLPVGTYMCYTTGEGHLGRALLVAVDPNTFMLTLDLLTWVTP